MTLKTYHWLKSYMECSVQTAAVPEEDAMAGSSADGIPAQLAALLGHPVKRIRITDETPPRISVIDVATAITGKHVRNAARDVLFVQEKHPEVFQKLSHFRFPGQGQRSTPVTCATGLISAWQM